MELRTRILNVVREENGGPRSRNVLRGLARKPGEVACFEKVMAGLLARGELVKIGDKRGARYGLPRRRA